MEKEEKVGKFIKKNERKFIDFFSVFLNCCKIFFGLLIFREGFEDEDGQDFE